MSSRLLAAGWLEFLHRVAGKVPVPVAIGAAGNGLRASNFLLAIEAKRMVSYRLKWRTGVFGAVVPNCPATVPDFPAVMANFVRIIRILLTMSEAGFVRNLSVEPVAIVALVGQAGDKM